MTDEHKHCLKMDVDRKTLDTFALQVGRITLGKGEGGSIRIWALPDGIHVTVPKDSKFVRVFDHSEYLTKGWTPPTNEGD